MSGKRLRIEAIGTVQALENMLLSRVAKQWYDYDRKDFTYVKQVKAGFHVCIIENMSKKQCNAILQPVFVHESDFDMNGIIYWIGTNGRTAPGWVNPSKQSLVNVTTSDGRQVRRTMVASQRIINVELMSIFMRISFRSFT